MTPTPFTALETIRGTFRNQIRILEQNMPRADSVHTESVFTALIALAIAATVTPTARMTSTTFGLSLSLDIAHCPMQVATDARNPAVR